MGSSPLPIHTQKQQRLANPHHGFYLMADGLADLPIQLDEGIVHRLHRPLACRRNQLRNFGEIVLRDRRCCHVGSTIQGRGGGFGEMELLPVAGLGKFVQGAFEGGGVDQAGHFTPKWRVVSWFGMIRVVGRIALRRGSLRA